jgi:O-antigen/teichoic acid export membrane protein
MMLLNRIAINTIASYGRSLLAAAMAVLSSGWVLQGLGQTDFGLYSLIGSIIAIITFLSSALSNSASRFFAYSIGRGKSDELGKWFNIALSIHLHLALALTAIGWLIGTYFIGHLLSIPHNRIEACLWVFRIALLSAFAGMALVPYTAIFTARQHISELAFWGLLKAFLIFILAWYIAKIHVDRFMYYAIGMGIILIVIAIIQMFRARALFDECRIVIRYWYAGRKALQFISFAAWNLIGSIGSLGRDQGTALLLNGFFGPNINAAYGIAAQVSTQADQLASAIINSFAPEIATREGGGNRKEMLSLSMRASKYGTLLVMLFAIPLIFEMDNVLRIWLGRPPAYTSILCRFIILTFLLERMTTGYMLAINAKGKIAAYQLTVGMCLVITLPLEWCFLKFGYGPSYVGMAFVLTMILVSIGRVIWGRILLRIPIVEWIKSVVVPCALVAVASIIASLIPSLFMAPSLLRIIVSAPFSLIICLTAIWFFALDSDERAAFKHKRLSQKNNSKGK